MNKTVIVIVVVFLIVAATLFFSSSAYAETVPQPQQPPQPQPGGTPDINGKSVLQQVQQGLGLVSAGTKIVDLIKDAIPAVGGALGIGSGAAAGVVEAALPAIPAASVPATVQAAALTSGATAGEAAAAGQAAANTVAAGGSTSEAIASGASAVPSLASLITVGAIVVGVGLVVADATRDQGYTVDPKTGARIFENSEFDYFIDPVTGKHVWEMNEEELAGYEQRQEAAKYLAELQGFTELDQTGTA